MANIAKLAVKITSNSIELVKDLNKSTKKIESFSKSTVKYLKTIQKVGVVSVGALVASTVALVTIQSKAAQTTLRLSDSIGVSADSIYKWSAAAKKMGVDAEKMNDILKDVSDKTGDFLATGGGEGADIFEKLNLDAAEFVNLNAADALLKIGEAVSGLGINQQVFYMESLANEASKLLPLFKNGAAEYKSIVAEAQRSGNILTNEQTNAAAAFGQQVDVMRSKFTGFSKQLTVQLSAPLAQLIVWFDDVVEKAGGVESVAKNFANAFVDGIVIAIVSGASLIDFFDRLEAKMIGLQIVAVKTAKSLSFANVAEEAGKLFDDEFEVKFFGDLSKLKAEKKKLEEKSASNKNFVDAAYEKGAELKGLMGKTLPGQKIGGANNLGGTVSNETIMARNAYKKSAQEVDKLAKASNKAAASIQRVNSSVSQAPSESKTNKFDPWSSAKIKTGWGGVKLKTTWGACEGGAFSGMTGGGGAAASSGGIKSMADYIKQSAAGSGLAKVFARDRVPKGGVITPASTEKIMQIGKGSTLQPATLPKDSFNGSSNGAQTSIKLDLTTDTGRVEGELLGSQTFINEMSRLVSDYTNRQAGQVT